MLIFLLSLARRLPFLVDGISFFVSAWLVRTGLPRDAQRHALPVLPGANPATTTVEGAGTAGASSNGAGAILFLARLFAAERLLFVRDRRNDSRRGSAGDA